MASKMRFFNHLRQQPKKLFTSDHSVIPEAVTVTSGITMIIHDYVFDDHHADLTFADDIMRIDYAYHGAVRVRRQQDYRLFLEPKFLKLSVRDTDKYDYQTIDGYYQGITLLIHTTQLSPEFMMLVADQKILQRIQQRLLADDAAEVLVKSTFIDTLFADLKQVAVRHQNTFLQLKIAELLLYCDSDAVNDALIPQTYLPATLVQTIYSLQHYLQEHLDENLTLQQLSQKFSLGQSTMQQAFKRVYCQSIHSFVMTARLAEACHLLTTTSFSIRAIADQIGYRSASKFSAFFKTHKQMTPTAYRRLMTVTKNLHSQ